MNKGKNSHMKSVYVWLITCNVFIYLMIIIGAITRLTESGLSMVEWKPLIGALPPLNDAEWTRVFDLYRETPEFQKINFWMGIDDFKTIFFWEWLHRLWGRTIGLIFALPFIFYIARGWIPEGYKLKLFGIFVLGGLQGYMGWYMVQSGLVDQPSVSHYRLAAHLSIALLIYSFIFWNILDFRQKIYGFASESDSILYAYAWACLGMLILTIFWGAYTAGLDAGLVYNETFPKMGGDWVPSEIWFRKPFWVNFFETHAGVQFAHRWLAISTTVIVMSFGIYAVFKKRQEVFFPLLGVFVLFQAVLGITTLLSGVNIVVAVAHQGGAVILLSLLLCCLHILRPLRAYPVE